MQQQIQQLQCVQATVGYDSSPFDEGNSTLVSPAEMDRSSFSVTTPFDQVPQNSSSCNDEPIKQYFETNEKMSFDLTL